MSENKTLKAFFKNVSKVIVGKQDPIFFATVTLLARGHLLIEDAPGLGKTMLARSMAKSLSVSYKRLQCTPDLMPSDITGVSIFNDQTRKFEFRPGPLFTNLLLVDEINRATPRAQSALLEAMAEAQVSVDGKSYKLRKPFMVIATQNPIENHGTYPLPEAQLDRFFMRISMGYPTLPEEAEMMSQQCSSHPINDLKSVLTPEQLTDLQDQVAQIHIDSDVMAYIAAITQKTREHESLAWGASPRASLAMMRAAQAAALIKDEPYVDPSLVKLIAKPVLSHRIVVKPQLQVEQSTEYIISSILDSVPVPVANADKVAWNQN
ncbi:MAG TPA: MoxR family ATPase [Crenotrichaceae bacterium]|nr:MoxR family ATPase [Crenotrichaceae bacterium]